MAELGKPVVRGGFGRFWREAVDRMFLGNQGFDYRTGMWDRPGVIRGAIGGGTNTILGPLASAGYGLWSRHDVRNGGDGIPFANVAGNPQGTRVGDYLRGTVPTGFVPGGAPTGVAPGGLSGLASGVGAGAGGLAGLVPQQPPPGGPMQIDPVTLQPVDRYRTTLSTIGGSPVLNVNTGPQALSHMGGARSAFNHGGTSITGDAARSWMESQKYTPLSFNFRYGQGDLSS